MGILQSMFERRTMDENTAWGLVEGNRIGAYGTPAGVTVTPTRAMELTAVYAAVRILAEGLASLPLVTYRRLAGGGKERASDHPLYALLHDQPNSDITSFVFRETLMGHLLLYGNAYAEIEYDAKGRVVALWPLQARDTEPRWVGESLYYVTVLPEKFGFKSVGLPAERVLHIRGLSPDGLTGYSPIRLARRAIGLAAATEEYGAAFFGNGAQPGGVLEHPGHMSDEAHTRLKKDWEELHQGLENSHRIAILEEGMKYDQITIPPEDAQFLETRKFQISEIARIFRVPPHMLADLDRATFSNIEEQSLEFVEYSLRPWLVRWEQEISRCLLTPAERQTYFAEFLVDGLLRGDVASRYAAYHTAWTDGWLTWNEIRERENMNPVEGGDVHFAPLNMMPVGQNAPQPPSPAPSATRSLPGARSIPPDGEERSLRSINTRRRIMLSYRPVISEAAARVIRRESHDIAAAAKRVFKTRGVEDFNAWLDDYYPEYRQVMANGMHGTMQTYAELIAAEASDEVHWQGMAKNALEAFVGAYVTAMVSRHVFDSRTRLDTVVKAAQVNGQDIADAIGEAVAQWEQDRADTLAKEESVRLNGATSKAVYKDAGRTTLTWRAGGKSCPYCADLDGMVVGIEDNFLNEGDSLHPDGADGALDIHSSIGHPPAHDGCECGVSAY